MVQTENCNRFLRERIFLLDHLKPTYICANIRASRRSSRERAFRAKCGPTGEGFLEMSPAAHGSQILMITDLSGLLKWAVAVLIQQDRTGATLLLAIFALGGSCWIGRCHGFFFRSEEDHGGLRGRWCGDDKYGLSR